MSYVELRNRNVISKKSAIESAFTTLGKTARPAKSVSASCNFSSFALAGEQNTAGVHLLWCFAMKLHKGIAAGMSGRASHQGTCKKQSKAHFLSTGKITASPSGV